MFSTELLPVPRNINSCSSIADGYHGYPLVHVNTPLSQSRGQDHRVAKPALNAQH